jgi:hypothetical protein
MKNFFIWITALSKVYEERLVCPLLNRGYTITAAANTGKVNIDTYDSAALFALKVSKEEANQYTIYDDVINILSGMQAFYYSVVIVEASEAIPLWQSTNIKFDSPIPNIGQPKKKELN